MSQFSFTPAFLVIGYTEEQKVLLQRVGATHSRDAKGYFITAAQKEQLESGNVREPSIPTTVTTRDGVTKVSRGIDIVNMGSEWKIAGDTYNKRDKIKAIGGRWNKMDSSWRIPLERTDEAALRILLA